MPFGNITVGTDVYEPRSPGVYVEDSVTLGDPTNEIRIKPAVKTKDGKLILSLTSVKEVDVGTPPVRKQVVVYQSLTFPADGSVTASDLDAQADIHSTFLTTDTLTRMSQGEI